MYFFSLICALISSAATTVDTSEFMEQMSEDQITKLSEEFDRRTQDDGQITGGDTDRRSRGSTPRRREPDSSKDIKRKTSYSEIKLSQPAKSELVYLNYFMLLFHRFLFLLQLADIFIVLSMSSTIVQA